MSVAATAGCTVNKVSRDMYGVDIELVRSFGAEEDEEIALKVQLKSTTRVRAITNEDSFPYKFKNAEHLRRLSKPRSTIKMILVVMTIHADQTMWTTCSHKALSMLHCSYWANLEGLAIPSAAQPTVRIPTANIFDAKALTGILDRIQKAEVI